MTVQQLKDFLSKCNDASEVFGIFTKYGGPLEICMETKDPTTVYLVSEYCFPVKRAILEAVYKKDPDYKDKLLN